MTAEVLILRRYSFGDSTDALSYGTTRVLADCGHDAWIAPTSAALVAERGVLTVCTDCAPAGPVRVETPPGVREELARRIGVAAADQRIAEVKERAARDGLGGLLS